MTGDLVTQNVFEWAVTLITGIVAGAWFIWDAIKLVRLKDKKGDADDAIVHDKRFGYAMGMVIGFVGVWGCLRFHGVV